MTEDITARQDDVFLFLSPSTRDETKNENIATESKLKLGALVLTLRRKSLGYTHNFIGNESKTGMKRNQKVSHL